MIVKLKMKYMINTAKGKKNRQTHAQIAIKPRETGISYKFFISEKKNRKNIIEII